MVNPIIDKKYIERDTNRYLLMFYDLLVFAVCFIGVYVIAPSDFQGIVKNMTFANKAILFILAFGCLLAARLLFKAYKQIYRYGNMRAFARMMGAEVVGGLAFLILARILPIKGTVFTRMLLLLLLDYAAVISTRIVYYYLYLRATVNNKSGNIIKRLLEVLGGVDVESRQIARTLTLAQVLGADPDTKAQNLPINDIVKVVRQFDIHGNIQDIRQITKGYINKTYRILTIDDEGKEHKYILQRINTDVFTDVDLLMDNYEKVTNHLSGNMVLPGQRGKASNPMPKPLKKNGKYYLKTDSGCWRMLNYFEHIYTMDIPDSPKTFYRAGLSFGLFLKAMSDVPADAYEPPIKNFHNTKTRYMDLLKAIDDDPMKRVKDVITEIKFLKDREENFGLIVDALESGKIPTRITHNDCNLNNILFDKKTQLPVAIIDLDTVMPGSPLYDFGDSMRIGTNTAVDDEKDLSKVSCDLNLYEHYARGYLEACGKIMTKEELELLPWSSIIITCEDGIRFLMDHINGDTYYNIFYPGQNLDRARTQLKLVEDMEKKLPQIKEILRGIYKDLGLQATID